MKMTKLEKQLVNRKSKGQLNFTPESFGSFIHHQLVFQKA